MNNQFLITQMTAEERERILTNPQPGMIIYNTTASSLEAFQGGSWQSLSVGSSQNSPILQTKSWYKNDTQVKSSSIIGAGTPAVVIWNKNADGSNTGWTATSGNPSLTFLNANSGYSIEVNLFVGFRNNARKYLLGFVEFSSDNGVTWNLVETTPKVSPQQTLCSFSDTITTAGPDVINNTSYFFEKKSLPNKAGDTYLFRVRIVCDSVTDSQNLYTINSTGSNSGTITANHCTCQSSFRLMEIN